MAGAGIVTGCGEGLERNRAATRITGRNDVADDEPGETGSLCYVTNPWYPVRYRRCFRDWMYDDVKKISTIFFFYL